MWMLRSANAWLPSYWMFYSFIKACAILFDNAVLMKGKDHSLMLRETPDSVCGLLTELKKKCLWDCVTEFSYLNYCLITDKVKAIFYYLLWVFLTGWVHNSLRPWTLFGAASYYCISPNVNKIHLEADKSTHRWQCAIKSSSSFCSPLLMHPHTTLQEICKRSTKGRSNQR